MPPVRYNSAPRLSRRSHKKLYTMRRTRRNSRSAAVNRESRSVMPQKAISGIRSFACGSQRVMPAQPSGWRNTVVLSLSTGAVDGMEPRRYLSAGFTGQGLRGGAALGREQVQRERTGAVRRFGSSTLSPHRSCRAALGSWTYGPRGSVAAVAYAKRILGPPAATRDLDVGFRDNGCVCKRAASAGNPVPRQPARRWLACCDIAVRQHPDRARPGHIVVGATAGSLRRASFPRVKGWMRLTLWLLLLASSVLAPLLFWGLPECADVSFSAADAALHRDVVARRVARFQRVRFAGATCIEWIAGSLRARDASRLVSARSR